LDSHRPSSLYVEVVCQRSRKYIKEPDVTTVA
jgi:hypothetical protein